MLRRELDETQARIAAATDEAEVRRLVAAVNERIVYVNSHTTSGPPTDLMPLSADRVVDEWRRRRSGSTPADGSAAGSAG